MYHSGNNPICCINSTTINAKEDEFRSDQFWSEQMWSADACVWNLYFELQWIDSHICIIIVQHGLQVTVTELSISHSIYYGSVNWQGWEFHFAGTRAIDSQHPWKNDSIRQAQMIFGLWCTLFQLDLFIYFLTNITCNAEIFKHFSVALLHLSLETAALTLDF